MKRDFDFNSVGKKLPYEVSPEFFDDFSKNIMQKVNLNESKPVKKQLVLKWSLSVAATVAVLFGSLLFLSKNNNQPIFSKVMQKQSSKIENVVEPLVNNKQSKAENRSKAVIKTHETAISQNKNDREAKQTVNEMLEAISTEELNELLELTQTDNLLVDMSY